MAFATRIEGAAPLLQTLSKSGLKNNCNGSGLAPDLPPPELALTRELQHSVQELRTKIKQAKKMGELKACTKSLSQESVQLAASILNVSTADLEEILEVEEDEETVKAKKEFEKDKEWLQYIQKLLEAQFPFASYLMDAILEKLNEKKKLVEEYTSLMKHTV